MPKIERGEPLARCSKNAQNQDGGAVGKMLESTHKIKMGEPLAR